VTKRALVVALAGAALAAVLVLNMVDAARPDAGHGDEPYVTLYARHRTQVEAVLVSGDGQAFAALAQDPSLARPGVIRADGEYAYRAQRPLWGYLAWAGSLGQAGVVGWVLVVLEVLAAGFACGVVARLLLDRGANPWWALVTIAFGYESITTLTPELLALALFGTGILLWQRDRRAWAVVALCGAVLTRETMLIGVAAVALWQLAAAGGGFANRVRRALPLAVPVGAVAVWDVVIRLRLGAWPTGSSESRLTLPGIGLLDSFVHQPAAGLAVGVLVAGGLGVTTLLLRRHDPLTWVTGGYGVFALTFSREVWVHAGFTRALLPLYVLGTVVVVAAVHARGDERSQTTVGELVAAG
jgi:hypothetical protein